MRDSRELGDTDLGPGVPPSQIVRVDWRIAVPCAMALVLLFTTTQSAAILGIHQSFGTKLVAQALSWGIWLALLPLVFAIRGCRALTLIAIGVAGCHSSRRETYPAPIDAADGIYDFSYPEGSGSFAISGQRLIFSQSPCSGRPVAYSPPSDRVVVDCGSTKGLILRISREYPTRLSSVVYTAWEYQSERQCVREERAYAPMCLDRVGGGRQETGPEN